MSGGADRAYARSSAPVRYRKGLVQIQMTHICAEIREVNQAYLGVHIGAVEIDLAAICVHDLADLLDVLFKNTMRRWVGDHDGRKTVTVLLGLGGEVLEVEITPCVALDRDNFVAGHHRAGGVGSVRRHRNETYVPVPSPRAS